MARRAGGAGRVGVGWCEGRQGRTLESDVAACRSFEAEGCQQVAAGHSESGVVTASV